VGQLPPAEPEEPARWVGAVALPGLAPELELVSPRLERAATSTAPG